MKKSACSVAGNVDWGRSRVEHTILGVPATYRPDLDIVINREKDDEVDGSVEFGNRDPSSQRLRLSRK